MKIQHRASLARRDRLTAGPQADSLPYMAVSAVLIVCAMSAQAQTTTLKDAFQGIFRIGSAVDQAQFEERDARGDAIIESQFNTISPENVLKWEAVHPRLDTYNFDPGDRYVAFG